ncbi:MAG: flagellar biosynthetic protein FliR, partial [Candidatus Poribacteria bacterium]
MEMLRVPTLAAFLLVLFRISGLMMVAPLFGERPVPFTVKISLSLVLALVLFPLLSVREFHMELNGIGYAIIVFALGMVTGCEQLHDDPENRVLTIVANPTPDCAVAAPNGAGV